MRNVTSRPAGFTLIELLTAVSIITFIAGMLVVALAQVREDARAARTKSQVNRINQLLITRWDSYRTRKVPLSITTTNLTAAGTIRLNAIRELMRMELPDRKTDVEDNPVALSVPPALTLRYRRIVSSNGGYASWSATNQGAECLYMILGSIQTEGGNGLEYFRGSEIGDKDGDGMREILDAWGNPIEFIRWPVGLSATRQAASGRSWSVIQHGDTDPLTTAVGDSPDPFDYLKVDPRWNLNSPDPDVDGMGMPITTNEPFAIFPLVISAGPDKVFDIVFDTPTPLRYSQTDVNSPPSPPNDPYVIPNDGGATPVELPQIGEPVDSGGSPAAGFWDNISNHQGLDN